MDTKPKITISTFDLAVIKGGFIIYDDYGHWKGQYDAVKAFHKDNNIKPLLVRTSRKERIEIK